jgi:phenylalanyl-tRNA synthetase alpha chain
MIEDVKRAGDTALARISEATTADEVRARGRVARQTRAVRAFKTGLGALATVDERKAAGQAVNEATNAVTAGLDQRRRELAAAGAGAARRGTTRPHRGDVAAAAGMPTW